MGYFYCGMVLGEAPDWSKLESFDGGHGLRGYRHGSEPVWLLECWRIVRGRGEPEPFQGAPSDALLCSGGLGTPGDALAERLEAIRKVLGRTTAYGTGYVHAATQVARSLGQPVYFFAADDDVEDIAIRSDPEGPVRIGAWFGLYRFSYSQGQTTIRPFLDEEEDEDFGPETDELEQLAEVEGLTLLPSETLTGGKTLFDNPVRLWPTSLGDPESLLGLGTWDPFDGFEGRFEPVFHRPPS